MHGSGWETLQFWLPARSRGWYESERSPGTKTAGLAQKLVSRPQKGLGPHKIVLLRATTGKYTNNAVWKSKTRSIILGLRIGVWLNLPGSGPHSRFVVFHLHHFVHWPLEEVKVKGQPHSHISLHSDKQRPRPAGYWKAAFCTEDLRVCHPFLPQGCSRK